MCIFNHTLHITCTHPGRKPFWLFFRVPCSPSSAGLTTGVVGFHPEGTRGKGPDPYDILPAQPGIGRALYKTRAPVVPVFVVGLSNNFAHQLLNGFRGKVDPVYAFYGEPIDLSDLYRQSGRASTYLRIANRVREHIVALGQRVKALDESRRGVGVTPPGVS